MLKNWMTQRCIYSNRTCFEGVSNFSFSFSTQHTHMCDLGKWHNRHQKHIESPLGNLWSSKTLLVLRICVCMHASYPHLSTHYYITCILFFDHAPLSTSHWPLVQLSIPLSTITQLTKSTHIHMQYCMVVVPP